MTNLEYEKKELYVSIEGKEYALAPNSEKVAKLLREQEKHAETASLYDADMELLTILLGKTAVNELFPDGENEDLNRLHFYAIRISQEFARELNRIENTKYDEVREQLSGFAKELEPLKPWLDASAEKQREALKRKK